MDKHQNRRRVQPSILKHSFLGVLVALLLIIINSFVIRTRIGHKVEIETFRFLQDRLDSFKADERLPILVVDISKVPGGKDQVTSRNKLEPIIEAIANQHPSAIAIDIDFSPEETGWKTDDDPKFFDFCLELKRKKGIPIILGVYNTLAEPADTWLGLGKYKELAAALAVAGYDTRRMPRWVQAQGVADRLPTLSAALASAYQPSLPKPPSWLTWALETTTDNQHGIEQQIENQMTFGQTLVNYSKLEQIQHETISTISPTSVTEAGRVFAGKMVLLGDATDFTDAFLVPGRAEPIPGVYLEACAADTLAIEPLYEFSPLVRLALDLVISIILILGVQWIRLRYVNKRAGSRFKKMQGRFIYILILLIIFFGILLTYWLNVLWLDFLLVIFALLMHPTVENSLSTLWGKVRSHTIGGG